MKYSDPTGHLVWFAIGAAIAIYDGVKAYKKAKKEGKSGWRAVGAVVKSVAVGAVVGKIGKAFKATTKVVQIGKKVFKTKPLKKLYGKPVVHKGSPPRIKASGPAKNVKPPSSSIKRESKSQYVNLASEGRTKHILFGDATGGGHMWPGALGKTPFPKGWSGDKIMHQVSDIVSDPNLKWIKNRVVKGVQRYEVVGIRGGVKIKVITDGKDIITAFPVK